MNTQLHIATVEYNIIITFSNKESIEVSKEQYSELIAKIIQDICKECKINHIAK
jgi:hypothetical protein